MQYWHLWDRRENNTALATLRKKMARPLTTIVMTADVFTAVAIYLLRLVLDHLPANT
ncbi:hypothetical protein [Marinobacter psychrophilus]|jgi:hypothetical protein|uniref:hypothetical protein n=1 Tax=Marinobacter psychrophilus TaxID=330734 RepID=UPI001B447202|nr:hypothetical protein [Marinobacter psychrophilus]MBQ0763526.1 hypothetical protein [Marinobacter psychrophilus]MBQ0845415.1 hypothetical protein [Marinobacter psychrophilus]